MVYLKDNGSSDESLDDIDDNDYCPGSDNRKTNNKDDLLDDGQF